MLSRFRLLEIAKEFLRYVIVGGAAFFADVIVLVVAQESFLKVYSWGVYLAAVLGFVAGLTVNYVLSVTFAFGAAKKGKGRSFGAFIVFTGICLLGLFFTEIGMWIGIELFNWHYAIVKVLVAGLVLLWNYSAKRVLLFS